MTARPLIWAIMLITRIFTDARTTEGREVLRTWCAQFRRISVYVFLKDNTVGGCV